MKESFGTLRETTIAKAMQSKTFKNAWTVSKDKIAVCKVCEFRYICTDCRAYIADPDNALSKPAKCKYNPITAVWES